MSELINNREFRKEAVKEIIFDLHKGKSVEEVKMKFDELVKDITPTELSLIENELINEGVPIEEVRRLCDVHLAVFKEALDKTPDPEVVPGHPVYTLKRENRAIENLIDEEVRPLLAELKKSPTNVEKDVVLKLIEKINLLWDVEKHYSRKENLLFPYLEKYEITGPSKIMWSHDDEIRDALKEVKTLAINYHPEQKEQLIYKIEDTLNKVTNMITKEEKVLLHTALQVLSEDEWYQIAEDSDEIGYCLIEPAKGWKPERVNLKNISSIAAEGTKGVIKFDTGILTPKEISLVFNLLPVDITFVDKEGIVKYFSAAKERIFPRTRTIIGRKVENCHPPASIEIVETLIQDLKNGKKDHEDFWLRLGDKYVLIRYFAVRDEKNEFIGVLEVSQDIKPIQAITGEKRILD